jgi:site-specific DNA recombinase
MIQAIAIYRVSTAHQVESGNGLQAQKDSVHSYASKNGFTIVSEHSDEGISGSASLDKRKGLVEALQALEKGSVLLVHKMDRLSRDLMLQLIIEKEVSRKGARIVSASGEGNGSDNPADVLMRRMLGCFAEYEKNLISIRTKQALAARKNQGLRYSGKLPYGFQEGDNRSLVQNPSEQQVIALVRGLRSDKTSWRVIADRLNGQGVLNRSGRKWSIQNLHKTMKAAL